MAKHKEDPSKRVPQHYLAYQFINLVHSEEAAKQAESQHRALFKKTTLSDLTKAAEAAKDTPPTSPAQGIFSTPIQKQPETAPSNPLHLKQDRHQRTIADWTSPSLNPFAKQVNATNNSAMHIVLPKSLVYNQPIARVLFHADLVSSRSEGHRISVNKGAYIGSSASDHKQMGEDLNFVPAKLQDPMQTWRYVMRDDEARTDGAMEHPGEEGLLILRVGKWKVRLCRIVTDDKFEELLKSGEVSAAPPGYSEWKAQEAALRSENQFLHGVPETEVKVSKTQAKKAEREQRRQGLEYFKQDRAQGINLDEADVRSRARANVGS